MSPEKIRAMDHACLARYTLEALGANGRNLTAEEILDHSVAQACLELEAVENILERNLQNDPELATLVYVVSGIRKRLVLARECNEILADVFAGSEAAQ
jgi:hypothetical protein